MQKYQYITVETILAKYYRDFRGLDINEGDAIEWIGEALGYIKMASVSEEAVIFAEVKNHHTSVPLGLHYITMIAQNNNWEAQQTCSTVSATLPVENTIIENYSEDSIESLIAQIQSQLVNEDEIPLSRPHFGLAFPFQTWASSEYCRIGWTPVRLANHVFFNSLVCKVPDQELLYNSCRSEYTIVEDTLRFNFKEGFVAIACLRQKMDEKGYPMIPDDEYAKAAITYYLAWKIKQREAYNHREGAASLSKDAEAQWNSYIKKFKNKTKMPWGVDDYQDLMQQSNYMIPNHNRYYGFFGKLNYSEQRTFNRNR